jgi:hypothetical protein
MPETKEPLTTLEACGPASVMIAWLAAMNLQGCRRANFGGSSSMIDRIKRYLPRIVGSATRFVRGQAPVEQGISVVDRVRASEQELAVLLKQPRGPASYIRIGDGEDAVMLAGPRAKLQEIVRDHISARWKADGRVFVTHFSPDLNRWVKDLMQEFPADPIFKPGGSGINPT